MGHLMGRTLGNYEVRRLLGAGGMGAVFLARQISLDRDVALKVLPNRFASNPEALARFTREALSAAELNHPNIVQVHDVGAAQGQHFICMEYVPGETLAAIVRRDGRLRLDTAVGYVLQAARGLKYAHDRNIVHRDIKPDNLMLSDQGVVKIADMGLAKRVGMSEELPPPRSPQEAELRQVRGDLTQARHGLGTPAYMAPEQARDAVRADARADQYSLGCTLYYLCAGKAPYSGTTALELINKHQREPLTPLDTLVPGVSPELSRILNRMLAKAPEQRYPDMQYVIGDLERYLGVDSVKGPYKPGEHHLASLDAAHAAFYAAPGVRRRALVRLGFGLGVAALAVAALFTGRFAWAGGLVGFLLFTGVASFLVGGIVTRDYLLRRLRSLFFGMPLVGWVKTLGGVALGLGVLYMLSLSLLVLLAGAAVLAVGVALLYEVAVGRPLRHERAAPLDAFRKELRELRLRGLSEQALQDFVCRFSAQDWEEFFEALFGYEALIVARARLAASGAAENRRRYATWRDPLARWIEAVASARRESRERKALARVETQRLRAAGLSARDAQQKAEEEARIFAMELYRKRQAIMARAARGAAIVPPGTPVPPGPPLVEEEKPKQKLTRAEARAKKKLEVDGDYVPISYRPPLTAREIFWRAVRAVIGLGILLLAWMNSPATFDWSTGSVAYGLLAGAGVFLSAFSGRTPVAVASIAGAVLVLGYQDLTQAVGLADYSAQVFWVGVALVAIGGGTPVLDLLLGGRKR
jgi:hypothetical protein